MLKGYSKQTIDLFFNLYKCVKKINFEIDNKNERLLFELFLYFVLLDSLKIKNKYDYFVKDKNLYLFFTEKYKKSNIQLKDLFSINNKLYKFLKNKKKVNNYFQLILTTLKRIELNE